MLHALMIYIFITHCVLPCYSNGVAHICSLMYSCAIPDVI